MGELASGLRSYSQPKLHCGNECKQISLGYEMIKTLTWIRQELNLISNLLNCRLVMLSVIPEAERCILTCSGLRKYFGPFAFCVSLCFEHLI